MTRWLPRSVRASPKRSALLAVLTLLLAVIVIRRFAPSPATLEAGTSPPPAPAVETLVPATPALAAINPPRPMLPREPKRNPFDAEWSASGRSSRVSESLAPQPIASELAPSVEWNLELTLTTPRGVDSASAVINGLVLGVGDVVEGATVESIGAQEVVLVSPLRGRVVLRMMEQEAPPEQQ